MSAVVFDESFGVLKVAGAALVIVGVILPRLHQARTSMTRTESAAT
jgi:hypothetical protein